MALWTAVGDGRYFFFFFLLIYGAYLMILFYVLLFYDCKYTSLIFRSSLGWINDYPLSVLALQHVTMGLTA